MKRLFLSLSLFITMVAAKAADSSDSVSETVTESFKKEFPGAELLSWEKQGDYLKAIFIFSGYRSEAYFTEEGELQGSARSIFYSQLPLAVVKAVEKRFTSAEVLQVSEITNPGGTRYVLRLDAGNRKYKLRIDAGGNFIDIDKLKK
ncbi:MAG: hypothetical protein FJY20_05955 [Bacteroidetes bacterium]|nr:hypothetical protein [Bacteroidota bacterium]